MNLNRMRKHSLRDFSDVQTAEFDRLADQIEIDSWRRWVSDRWMNKYNDVEGQLTYSIYVDDLNANGKIKFTMKLRRPNEISIPPL